MFQQILNLQQQTCQFALDELWDCAEILGSFLLNLSSKADEAGDLQAVIGPGSHLESLAIYADALKGKGELRRAIDYYKKALHHTKSFRERASGGSRMIGVYEDSAEGAPGAKVNPAIDEASPTAISVIACATALRSSSQEIGRVEALISFQIAKCHIGLKDTHSALKALEAIPHRHKTPSMLVLIGKLYSRSSKERGTVNNYREALRQNSYALPAALGLLKHHSAASDVAMLCSRAPISSPDDLPWIEKLIEAHGHYSTNHYKQAIDSFTELERKFPNHVHILTTMATIHLQLNDKTASMVYFHKARAADWKSLEGMDIYASLIRAQRDLPRLNSLTKELLDINDKCAEAWIAVALFCDLKNDTINAIQFVEKALELDPNHLTGYIFRGMLQLRVGQIDASINDYLKAYSIRRDYNAYKGLVTAYLKKPKVSEALRKAKEALSLMPKDARAVVLVGKVLEHTGADGPKKAMKAYVKALKLDPLSHEAAIAYADLHLTLHHTNKQLSLQPAINVITKCLEHNNKDFIQAKLGELHTRAQNYSLALTHFQFALSMNPDLESAKHGMDKLEKLMRGIDPDMDEEHDEDADASYIDQDV